MKIVRLAGGLGNQMFLYAFARALAQYDETKLNVLSYNNVSDRKMSLDVFNICLDFATLGEVRRFRRWRLMQKLHLPCLYSRISEPDLLYHPELINRSHKNIYYTGYYQCEKYFSHVRSQILADFTLRVPLNAQNRQMLDKIKSVNSVSIHVRRGDYVQLQDSYYLCDAQYYNAAIEYISARVDNPHFFIFSDDIDWVRDNLKLDCNHTFVDINDGDTGYFDIELMKNCKHNIIANSSFSWWGAWLNNNHDKICVAPQKWFVKKQTDIIPQSWIKI